MPFKSLKQKKLILAAAHNPDFAEKVGFPQSKAAKFAEDAGIPIHKTEESKKPRFSKIMSKIGKK